MLLAVALNVADTPLHIELADELMETVGVDTLFTTIVILLEMAVAVVKQLPPVTVIWQLTTFPFVKPVEE